MKETAIYIHIPFCDHKCIYCDFYSIISYENVGNYLRILKKEIKYYADLFSNDRIITSVYFGGGTPSFMEPGYIGEIISSIGKYFNLSNNAEATLETNPGTVDRKKIKEFADAGVNRYSIGVQSFHDDELKFLTRIHDSATAVQTLYDTFNAGIENISIDLIFNLPGQTKQKWEANLRKALELPLSHISAYSLILERGTILNKMVLDKKVKIQDADYDAELYETTIDILTNNGFIQYEVSNFAKPNFECEHNNAYWHYKDYLGFGTSAHSFVDGRRWWNYSSLKFYLGAINLKGHAVVSEEELSESQMLEEYVMLTLRSSGLDLIEFKRKFGSEWIDRNRGTINLLNREGYLITNDNFIKFTKRGYALCDEILTKLL